ncbi:hypothetical protein GGI15_002145 [Coemansia interrupta]|uniref:C3H1-type domain-containing protein n=1 Tax=Coemansia interrupta TaxID=1126814 RepID=A0A9W8HGV0_9FUNG|nr:hypothetical protein GGI15_002145 [Coemansia interrupta]
MSTGKNIGSTSAVYNDVTRSNIEALFPSIRQRIQKSMFISIDTEFTGLAISNPSPVFKFNTTEWVTRATDMNEKYRAMTNIVKTHALVSMGISTFSRRHTRPGSYNVENFNFTLQQQNSHLINPNSVSFLAQNGFDLNKQATEGIRYFSGPNPKPPSVKTPEINQEGWMIREVFLDIVRTRVPLVIHNGLFDLMYVYQAFFGPLPDSYQSFVHDLSLMFPGGIYDTKHIVEKNDPKSASFLAYLFHKNERVQKQRLEKDEPAVCIRLKDRIAYKPKAVDEKEIPKSDNITNAPFCEQFAAHGHCRNKEMCPKSHDINFIIDCQDLQEVPVDGNSAGSHSPAHKKRKRDADQDNGMEAQPDQSINVASSAEANPSSNGQLKGMSVSASTDSELLANMYHTAAYDAFMTGYIYASYQILLGDKIADLSNQVFLMGQSGNPLLIKSGRYSSASITFIQTQSMFAPTSDVATVSAENNDDTSDSK